MLPSGQGVQRPSDSIQSSVVELEHSEGAGEQREAWLGKALNLAFCLEMYEVELAGPWGLGSGHRGKRLWGLSW